MASQCVSSGYVRMASFLYTKVWRVKEFVGKSERVLLTPDFALRVLEPRDSNYIIGTKYGKVLKNISFNSLATVFVPVLVKEHWWGVCFDIKGKAIRLIDSIFKNPAEKHADNLNDLVNAMDTMFEVNVPGYQTGTMRNWRTEFINIAGNVDNKSCGVIMLSCMKACAPRFVAQYEVHDLVKLRTTLMLDDLLSEYNDVTYAILEAMLPRARTRGGSSGLP
ncbi:uncharacterized protein [Spinacia oleracea]|uniref:Ubiquitin-like protease family profile domain-containing protein n=1 Tax=Spinacia oleracea TaxID=3562 RepID=A0ABM3R7F1_SPIOL|nr:uncharacterized protein LOC110776236 [Spinacia oleracea]